MKSSGDGQENPGSADLMLYLVLLFIYTLPCFRSPFEMVLNPAGDGLSQEGALERACSWPQLPGQADQRVTRRS